MLYPSAEDWEKWGIRDECHQFFVLHWDELFDTETSDSWQVRTCNTVTLLEEMVEAAQTADGFDAYRGVLRSILDEAFEVVRRDAIVRSRYPFVPAYLEPWRKTDIGKDHPAEVRRLATVVLGNLKDYWRQGVKLVLELLYAAEKGKKKDLYDATMSLAVATVARGRSTSYLREALGRTVLVESQVPFIDRVAAMFGGFNQGDKDYECHFLISGVSQRYSRLLPPEIRIRVGRPDDTPEVSNAFYRHVNRMQKILIVRVRTSDPEAAWRLADRRLGEVFAGWNLFRIEDRIQLRRSRVLVVDEDGVATIVSPRQLGSGYLRSYESSHVNDEILFQVLAKAETQDAAQISAAIQYHRLALQATSEEARVLNLWIALEALCQGDDGSIIQRVCALIAPCVSLENVQENMVSLARYVRFLWDDSDRADFLRLFPASTEERLDPQDLVNLLLQPEDHEDIGQLCRLSAKHPLILHRLFRIKTMLLDKPESVAESLEITNRHVEWQLKRIYRVRNAIVHTGSSTTLLPQLTQHLHCYLVKAIKSVLAELNRNSRWSIRDALEHRRMLFEHVVRFFKTTSGSDICATALLNPAQCMEPQGEPRAWSMPCP